MLNRTVRFTESGWEYEADQRHVEILVEQLKIDAAKAVTTPGQKESDTDETNELLNYEEASEFRAQAARANYLAMDRPDIAFAAKECCRRMSAPTKADQGKIKRLARYLLGKPRLIYTYDWTDELGQTDVHTDTDFAGCKLTRK